MYLEIISILAIVIFLLLVVFEKREKDDENADNVAKSVILLKPLLILIENPDYWIEKQELKNVNKEIYSKILEFSIYAAKQRAKSKDEANDMVLYMMNAYMVKRGFEANADYELLADIADNYSLRK